MFGELVNHVSILRCDFVQKGNIEPNKLLVGECQYKIIGKESFCGVPIYAGLEEVNLRRKKPWSLMGLEIIEVKEQYCLEVCFMTLETVDKRNYHTFWIT